MKIQIRGKLLLGFLTISIIFLIAGTLSIISINKLKAESHKITTLDVPTMDAVTQINLAVTTADIKLTESLKKENNGDIKEVWMNLEKSLWYSNAILEGDKNSDYTYLPCPIEDIRVNIKKSKNDLEDLVILSNSIYNGNLEDYAKYKSTYEKVNYTIKDTQILLKKHMDSSISYMNRSSESSSIILVIAITISFLVSLITGWVLSHSISNPLREITFRLEDISKGNFNQNRLDKTSNDELGILTDIYNTMLCKLSDFLKQADRIAIGDFTKDIVPETDKDSLAISFKKMTERLRVISEVANQVADGNTDISIEELSEKDALAQSINRMTKSIKIAISELRIKESNIDNLPTPVIAVDNNMNITFINKAGAQLKRMKPKELIGSKCYDVFNSTHCNTNDCCVCKTLISGKDEQGEMEIDTSFVKMPVTYSSSPIRNEHNEIIGALEFITDITEIKNLMTDNQEKIKSLTIENNIKVLYQSGLAGISNTLRESESILELADNICSYLAEYLDAQVLTFYNNNDNIFELCGSYAFNIRKEINSSFKPGEGLAGQAAKEKKSIIVTKVPEDYLMVKSSIGEISPRNIAIIPVLYKNEVKGVIEVGSLNEFTKEQFKFLNDISEPIAIALNRLETQKKLEVTLEVSQELTEELRASNEDLEEQALTLQATQAKLEIQQTELQAANEDLKDKSKALEDQKLIVDDKNIKLLEKADELEKSNSYKSEFLANMSHELRTPLNSILVLSNKLVQNKEETLTKRQVKNALIINECGNDLLNMINDILDIAKIESGNMDVYTQEIEINKIAEKIKKHYGLFVKEKNLELIVEIADSAPEIIINDLNKMKQITKNLLSNALKFTSDGSIKVRIYTPDSNKSFAIPGLKPEETLAISVQDTGIGIAEDKQQTIFEAFKQENGSITREYGGTGLGLSISSKLCELLGGELEMESVQGEGSTFTAYLKKNLTEEIKEAKAIAEPRILIIEDHKKIAELLKRLCDEKGYNAVISDNGTSGIETAKELKPEGIILNIKLSNNMGIEVMDKLKLFPETENIPIHLIKEIDNNKPELSDEIVDEILLFLESSDRNDISLIGKTALLVDDDVRNLYSLEEHLRDFNMNVIKATDGKMAIEMLKENSQIDIVLMDIMMPVMDGYESIKQIRQTPEISNVPIIALTAKVLLTDKEKCLRVGADDYLSKPVNIEKLINKTELWTRR